MNLASRLEGLNKVYGTNVLADFATQQAGEDGYVWRHLDRIIVAGKTQATDILKCWVKRGKCRR